MSAFSDYLEAKILNATLRGIAFPTPPVTTYVALFTADPLDDGSGGAELTNVTAPGYARVPVTSSSGWTVPSAPTPSAATTISNTGILEFPEATAPWAGPITHFAIFNAATDGDMLYHTNMTTPRTITTGGVLRFSIGSLVVGTH
jgi:hypothetical protein